MTEILITLIAALLALAVVASLGVAMHWGHKREHGLVPYILYTTLISVAVGVALSTRNLSLPSDLLADNGPTHPIAYWLSRFNSLFVLLACGERILYRMTNRHSAPPASKLLMVGFWAFMLTNVASPAFLGRYPSFSHEYLYMALFGQCVLLFSTYDADLTLKSIRNACLMFLVASALMIVINPTHVLNFAYHGLVPYLPRYAGLAPHANTMGPLVVVYLLCLWDRPFERIWLNRAAWALGLISLLLTQSKTSWISFMLATGCITFYRYRPMLAAFFANPRQPALPALIVLMMMTSVAVVGMIVIFADVGGAVDRMVSTKAGSELTSFTGRDQIWQIAMAEYYKNPIFGYGLTIWNQAFQISVGILGAVHAHSQFFHSASTSGTVGLLGLAIYASILLTLAIRTAKASGGLSIALFLMLVIHSVSEVPLLMKGFGLNSMPHLFTLVVLTAYSLPQQARTRVAQAKSVQQSRRELRHA